MKLYENTFCASWYARTLKTEMGEMKLLNKIFIFIFFEHKKYSHSFKNYGWTTDATWTILTRPLLTFMGLKHGGIS